MVNFSKELSEKYICGGEMVMIRHSEQGSYLCGDFDSNTNMSNVYLRKNENEEQQEEFSVQCIWMVENMQFVNQGQRCLMNSGVRLRHLMSGKVLHMDRDTKFLDLLLAPDHLETTVFIKQPEATHPYLLNNDHFYISLLDHYLQTAHQITYKDHLTHKSTPTHIHTHHSHNQLSKTQQSNYFQPLTDHEHQIKMNLLSGAK